VEGGGQQDGEEQGVGAMLIDAKAGLGGDRTRWSTERRPVALERMAVGSRVKMGMASDG
jgi:hypothetical protein